jgi:hypothetical protein
MKAALENLKEESAEQAQLAEAERKQYEEEQDLKMKQREQQHAKQMANRQAKLREVETKAAEALSKVKEAAAKAKKEAEEMETDMMPSNIGSSGVFRRLHGCACLVHSCSPIMRNARCGRRPSSSFLRAH